jgi:hypothetical protein
MLLFFLTFSFSTNLSVKYFSAIQLKNVYSKNRLSVTTDLTASDSGPPTIFSSRPPFDDGWVWTIESSNKTSVTRDAVRCGNSITLSNPITGLFVATRAIGKVVEVVPAPDLRSTANHWIVMCRDPPHWIHDAQIQLKNAKHGCYLSTTLKGREKETINKFSVTCSRLSAAAVWTAAEGLYFHDANDRL